MNGAQRLALMFGLVTLLCGCESSHRATYTGRLYSVAAVKSAFTQLGLRLHPRRSEPRVVRFNIELTHSNLPAGGAGTLIVATRRSAVGSTSLPGHEFGFANVSTFTKSSPFDEVRGALSALRWGTLMQGKPGGEVILPGKSIGPISLGEPRKQIEKALGPGKEIRPRLVSYLGGRIEVAYVYHDTPTKFAAFLWTRWPGYHTPSGAHVGSSRQDLRSLYATCAAGNCVVLEGPWPDALGTGFRMHRGKVTEISIGYA